MAMIAIVSGKGAPGVTTAVAVLASVWPSRVVVADCDPHGGDIAVGWQAQWWLDGWLRDHRGVLSFATTTRHATRVTPDLLGEHVQTVPAAGQVQLLVGLRDAAQATSVTDAGWRRLADALVGLGGDTDQPADVLVDCGRFGAATPWPLLTAADLVLIGVRPVARHLLAARAVVEVLRERIARDRLGLAVCAATQAGTNEAQRVLAVHAGLTLPDDPGAARVFSDGAAAGRRLQRSALVVVAAKAARRLHVTLNRSGDDMAGPQPVRANGMVVRPVIGARP